MLAQGVTGAGAAFNVEVAGGRGECAPFWLEIQGSAGSLRLEGGAARGLQAGRVTLLENGEPVAADEGELATLPDAAVNVGGVYAEFRDDIGRGSRRVAGFGEALELTRRIDAILARR
ncbi:MAG: hypothetical protein INR64_09995 [Caulobacteraceae bacterium]|nr:hypothetical protein [Caulobacter sp.]